MVEKPTYNELARQITELKSRMTAQHHVEQSLTELRLLMDSISDIVYTTDKKEHILFVNKAIEKISGFSPDDVMGRSFLPLFIEADHAPLMDAYKKTLGGESLEQILHFSNGLMCQFSSAPLKDENGRIIGTFVVGKDITRLSRTEQEYGALFSKMLDGFALHEMICDDDDRPLDYRFLAVNPSFEKMIGLNADRIIGKTVLEIMPNTERHWIDTYGNVVLTGKPIHFENYSAELDSHFEVTAYRPAENQFACIFKNITKYRKAEEALRESESKYRILVENLPQKIFYKDIHSVYLACNENFANDLNITTGEITGKTDHDFFNKKLAEKYRTDDDRILKSGKMEEIEESYVMGGKTRFVQTVKTPVLDDKGRVIGLLGIFWDITAQRNLEAQLKQSQKMESIGTMAGGIAHDFNNILGIIIGNTDLAFDHIPEWNPALNNLDNIKTASLRARDVIRQLLNFSRKTEQEQKAIKIHPLVSESIKLIRASIPSTIEIRSSIPDDSPAILADITQINQVLLNLYTNASHAMEAEGGILEIVLDEVELKEAVQFPYRLIPPGRYIQLIIRDTGSGIDNKIKDKIFDPYFTTKDIGKGTGMGLSVVHGIVDSHQGAISIDNRKKKGTIITILFPAIKEEITADMPEPFDVEPKGTESILFVDDEVLLLRMGKEILKLLGYKLTIATDPVKALDLFKKNPRAFDLIITDMTMPGITGDILTRDIIKIRPDMPVIICSGFNDKINSDIAKKIGAKSYIEKPIGRTNLAVEVRKVLDEAKHSD